MGDGSAITWHGCTLRGWGVWLPPTPKQGRARVHAILPTWAEVKASSHKHGSTVYTGRGRWSRAMLQPDLALGGRGYGLAPLPLTGSCTHIIIYPS